MADEAQEEQDEEIMEGGQQQAVESRHQQQEDEQPETIVVPERLLALNVQGVEHLSELRFQQAKAVFYNAIAEINRQQRHILEQPLDGINGPETDDDRNPTDPLILITSESITNQVSTQEEEWPTGEQENYERAVPPIDRNDQNAFRVYDKAFIVSGVPIPQQERAQEPDASRTRPIPLNESSLARTASAIMFNAGLAHHLQGRSNIDTQEIDFQRSLSLYRISARLLAVREGDGERTRLLLMGCYNNMAHIYIHFFDNRNLLRCLNGLRQVLAMGGQQSTDEGSHFALNLLVAENMDTQAAATA